jgi:hypothetical protein
MKQNGATDGWVADLLCKYWDWFFTGYDAGGASVDMENCDDDYNANREYLQFTFPHPFPLMKVRLQGIRDIILGGHEPDYTSDGVTEDEPISPLVNDEDTETALPLRSFIEKFEVWCNDGLDWWTVNTAGLWKKTEDLLEFSLNHYVASDPVPFEKIHKFSSGLSNYYQISEVNMPTISDTPCAQYMQCKEVRVVFTDYYGTALGTKIGLVVNDIHREVCKAPTK